MGVLTGFIRAEVWVLLGSLVIVVVYQMLTGRISFRSLLYGEDGNLSTARVQLLVATLVAAFAYVSQIISRPGEFPAIPAWLLVGLGGSELIYLWGKASTPGG